MPTSNTIGTFCEIPASLGVIARIAEMRVRPESLGFQASMNFSGSTLDFFSTPFGRLFA